MLTSLVECLALSMMCKYSLDVPWPLCRPCLSVPATGAPQIRTETVSAWKPGFGFGSCICRGDSTRSCCAGGSTALHGE